MKIVPAKFQFKPNEENFKFSKIRPDTIQIGDIEVSDEQTGEKRWQIQTHDYTPGAESYNQIAFRLELDDGDAYDREDLKLSINDSSRADGKLEWNDLTEEGGWWYQNTSYNKEKNGELTPNKGDVDCITAAGVFRVFVRVKTTNKIVHTSPWIYVLPSGVTIKDYLVMLNDLISLHDAFVTRSNSAVGIGEAVDDLEEWVTQMKCVLSRIERNPAVNLKKTYTKSAIHKLHKFDSRVFRDYMRSGGAGKTASIDYIESLDVYENRVIKTFLERLKTINQQLIEKPRYQSNAIELKDHTYLSEKDHANSDVSDFLVSTNYIYGTVRLSGSQRSLNNPCKISFRHMQSCGDDIYIVATNIGNFTHYPFIENNCYTGLCYTTKDKNKALAFLNFLCLQYKGIPRQGKWQNEFTINCGYVKKPKGQQSIYLITNINSINGCDNWLSKHRASDLIELVNKYSKDFSKNKCFFEICDQDYENEIFKRIADTRKKYQQKYDNACEKYYNSFENAKALLDTQKWLEAIPSDSTVTFPLNKTPKFEKDHNYNKIYSLMSDMVDKQYILSGVLDVNAFGVRDTQEIYEYWVFYKILSRLTALGFKPIETDITNFDDPAELLKNVLHNFVEHKFCEYKRKNTNKEFQPGSFCIKLRKIINGKNLDIEFYYNQRFYGILEGKETNRNPDYTLYFPDIKHYYFFDAKYKNFNETGQKEEVRDVAAKKYIHEMKKLDLFKDEDLSQFMDSPKIMGSYLIVANPSYQCINGNHKTFSQLLDIEYLTTDCDYLPERIFDDVEGCGPHPIGMVQLTPYNETAFNVLLKLIFEYKEGCDNGSRFSNIERDVCWECGSSDISRQTLLTVSNAEKYYVTCNTCGEFRVETHCLEHSGAHTLIKHAIDSYHMPEENNGKLTNWYVKCPYPHD